MSLYSYVVESEVHGLHSEWGANRLHDAQDTVNSLNNALFDKLVMDPLDAADFDVTLAEERAINEEYRRQMYVLSREVIF
jgi:hypothetical protein